MLLHQKKVVNPWDLEYGLQYPSVMDKIAFLSDDASSRASDVQQNAPGSETQFDNEEKMNNLFSVLFPNFIRTTEKEQNEDSVPSQQDVSGYKLHLDNEAQQINNVFTLQDPAYQFRGMLSNTAVMLDGSSFEPPNHVYEATDFNDSIKYTEIMDQSKHMSSNTSVIPSGACFDYLWETYLSYEAQFTIEEPIIYFPSIQSFDCSKTRVPGIEREDFHPRERIFSEYEVQFNNEVPHIINGFYLQDQFGISFEPFDPIVPSYVAQVISDKSKSILFNVNQTYLRTLVDKIEKEQCFQQNDPEFYGLETDLERFCKEYSLTSKELGEGASGKVFLATRNCDLKQAAVKKITLNPTNRIQMDCGKFLPKEIYFLNKVRDIDGCVKLLDYFIVGEECWITTEYHQNSITLTEFINNHGQLSEARVINLFQQILSIVSRLEMAGIAHRDLKGDNILVNENENILVIDFGLAESLERSNFIFCGTPGYMPPEVESSEAKYMIGPVTTWSLGVILGSLLIGREPFDNGRRSYEAKRVIDLELQNRNASRLARSLVRRCLQLTRDNRPSVIELLEDPWLNVDMSA